jgi:hypothetical protein
VLLLPVNLFCCLLFFLFSFLFCSLCRLMIGADGANSQVRKLGGFGSWGWGYGQEAVVCTVKVTARDPMRESSGILSDLPLLFYSILLY